MKFYCYRVSWEFSVKTQRKILPEYQKSAKSQRARIRRCHGEMHRSSSVHSKRFQWYMCVAILNQSQMSKSFIEFFFFGPFTNRAQMVELHPAKTNFIWNCFHFSFRFRHIHFHLSFKLRRGSVLVRFTHKKNTNFWLCRTIAICFIETNCGIHTHILESRMPDETKISRRAGKRVKDVKRKARPGL